MDRVGLFVGEVRAVGAVGDEAAARDVAPLVPSCPAWSVSDLLLHLGQVHRMVDAVLSRRLTSPPDPGDEALLGYPADRTGWPETDTNAFAPPAAPAAGPVPRSLVDWFKEGAARLADRFAATDPAAEVWTWSAEQTAGFWLRMQTIEAAVHRWDAQGALGVPEPMDAELAADAVSQTFEVMAPARRAWLGAVAGEGERFLFRRTDGPQVWGVVFDGSSVALSGELADPGIEIAGTASDLMLFLWGRLPGTSERLRLIGDEQLVKRYFTLVPPV